MIPAITRHGEEYHGSACAERGSDPDHGLLDSVYRWLRCHLLALPGTGISGLYSHVPGRVSTKMSSDLMTSPAKAYRQADDHHPFRQRPSG